MTPIIPYLHAVPYHISVLKRDGLLHKEVIKPKKKSQIKRYKNAKKKINYAVCILLNL